MVSRRSFLAVCALPAICRAEEANWVLARGGQFRSNDAGEIVEVNLCGRWVSAAEILDLLAYKKLIRLNLSLTRISDPDLLFLRPANQIEELNLAHAEHITDVGMSVIKDWKRLIRLDVSGTQAGNGTLALLSDHPQLESLDLAGSDADDDGMQHLLSLINLKHLGLGRSTMNESAVSILSLLDNLQSLNLSGAGSRRRPDIGLSRRRVEGMAQSLVDAMTQLRDLRILQLGRSQIDSTGVQILAASLDKLERFSLQECAGVEDAAVAAFVDWKSLRQLDLQGTTISSSALSELRKSRPDLQILADRSQSAVA